MANTVSVEVETVAEAYLTLLGARGVDYVFANGGTDFAPIVEGLAARAAKGADGAPRFVSVPHENAAVSMAHGYYLMTGRPQAVMFHVNVGTANGINALANAARDRVPMLFTAGRSPWTERGRRGSRDTGIHWAQEMFDQAGMVRELCKWEYELRMGEQLEDVIDRALEIATSEPCGPVYLSLPREVMSAPMTSFSYAKTPRRGYGTMPGPTPDAIARAAELLRKAQRPAIISRETGRTPANCEALAQFADRFAIPVIEYRALGNALPSAHVASSGFDPGPTLKNSDVILCLESDAPWLPHVHGDPAEGCSVIQIGVDPLFSRLPIRGFPCDVAITGAPSVVLPQLAAALDGSVVGIAARRKTLTDAQAANTADIQAVLGRVKTVTPIDPIWVTHCISQAKDPDAILINEYPLILRYLDCPNPRQVFTAPTAGGLGWGVGAAVGAKVAAPDRMVIANVGDGAYMFGNPTAAHQTLRALGLPVLYIVFNNSMWEEVGRAALSVFPDGRASKANRLPVAGLGPTAHFEHMMDIYGGYGERVEKPADLPAALQRAIHAVKVEKRQALLNVIVGRRNARP